MSTPIPISPEASAGILDALAARDIGWWPESKVISMDPPAKLSTLADGRGAPYDLFLGIPVHRAPQVVEESEGAGTGGSPSTRTRSPRDSRTSTRSAT